MPADVIDFYTRQKITVTEPAKPLFEVIAGLMITGGPLPTVWPEFSQAQEFHAPEKDAS